MIPNENPLDRAERILGELSFFLPLIAEPRAVLKGLLIGFIMKKEVSVPKELLTRDVGDIFIDEVKRIPLEGSLFNHENLGVVARLMLDLDDCGSVIAGRGYIDKSIKEWYLNL